MAIWYLYIITPSFSHHLELIGKISLVFSLQDKAFLLPSSTSSANKHIARHAKTARITLPFFLSQCYHQITSFAHSPRQISHLFYL